MKPLVARIQPHLFLSGLVVYALTAWFSEGYHHPDEHFQILEFANYKLGRTPEADLPWEYAAQIRPGLQPMLAYGFLRAAEVAGLSNPFTQVFLLRLLTGWLCLWVYFRWAHWLSTTSGEERLGNWLRWAVVFLWFVPYLSVRFSSENWAGLMFMWGVLGVLPRPAPGTTPPPAPPLKRRGDTTYTEPRNTSHPPSHSGEGPGVGLYRGGLAAFLLALSFFFRFQMGFALLGLGAWMAWQWRQEKSPRQMLIQLGWLLLGAAVATALGIWADAWLYGKPVFTAYNYFTANILENKAANWGTSPWWFYFAQSLLTAVPPLSVLLLLLLGRGLWRERGGALVWCLVPFLLAHITVAHKEMRFLYPMLLPMLVLAVQGLRGVWNADDADLQTRVFGDPVTPNHPVRFRKLIRAVCWTAVVVNFLLLPVRCVLAAQESVPYFRFLHGYAAAQPQPVAVFSQEKSVYNLVGLETHFYRSPKVQTFVVQRFDSDTLRLGSTSNCLLLSPKLTLQNPPPGLHTERIYTYFPDWILRFNPNDWQSRSRIWSLHECR